MPAWLPVRDVHIGKNSRKRHEPVLPVEHTARGSALKSSTVLAVRQRYVAGKAAPAMILFHRRLIAVAGAIVHSLGACPDSVSDGLMGNASALSRLSRAS